MKRILFTTLLACVSVASAMAQGIITISASAGSIQYGWDPTALNSVPVGNPAVIPYWGTLNIAFYGAPPGTTLSIVGGVPDLTGWDMQTSPLLHQIAPLPGAMPGVNVTMPSSLGAPGEDIQLEVVAWAGDYPSFHDAVSAGAWIAWTGSRYSGGGLGWTQPTGTQTLPVVINRGDQGFNGLVFSIPEPSTFVLASLGAAAILICRRQK